MRCGFYNHYIASVPRDISHFFRNKKETFMPSVKSNISHGTLAKRNFDMVPKHFLL